MQTKKEKIILSGGGTGGPVVPLIFINKKLKNDFDFLFVGTYRGIEKKIVESEDIRFTPIYAGKFRRYFSIYNFIDLFKIFIAFWQSLFLILKEKPSLVISAGGFVAVPLVFASWILRVPVLIHQQDVIPGLANRLMAPFAKIITVTFKKSIKAYSKKTRLIGNIGIEVNNFVNINKLDIYNKYKLDKNLPIIFVLGGGTGSYFVNNLIKSSVQHLSSLTNIIHISGNRDRDADTISDKKISNYIKFEFLEHQKLIEIMSVSDLVVSRCGLSTLTEISFLKKPAILIPMPNSHQEYNAWEFKNKKAAIVLEEKHLDAVLFIKEIKEILSNDDLKLELSLNSSGLIKNANQEMISIIKNILTKQL